MRRRCTTTTRYAGAMVSRWPSHTRTRVHAQLGRSLSTTARASRDPRIRDLGREISDDYAHIRDKYDTPRNTIVLAHGLLGFSELQIFPYLPAVQYWRGIKEALNAQGTTVICASVPPSSSIEDRAAKLRRDIDEAAAAKPGTTVNIIAHSMGGLDARYMISHLPPLRARVASLVTVSTPHRGSQLADALLSGDHPVLPRAYGLLARAGLGTEAFAQLTRRYVRGTFNPATPDRPGVEYLSYGASAPAPSPLSPFRVPWGIIDDAEGPNDCLVSVESSRWGSYQGTLVGVSHLDLINWTNRARWAMAGLMGVPRRFNAVAFYLDICDMLAKRGL